MNVSRPSHWPTIALRRLALLCAVLLGAVLGGRQAAATPVIYNFTAGTYTGWISYDPANAVLDPAYATGQSAVYRGAITDMFGTLSDGTIYNTFDLATVVLYGASGYYGLIFSGLSQWGYVEVDMFYYGSYQPLTGTGLPLAIDQTGLTTSIYIGGVRADNTNLQTDPVVQQTDQQPPVPEPSTLLIMGLGLIALAGAALRARTR